jgi:serine/alanine adding enzyme
VPNSSPAAVPDVYFSPRYLRSVIDEHAGETALSVERLGGAWRMPLVVRPLGEGWFDAASPYGYAGVWAAPEIDDQDAAAAWPDVFVELCDRHMVSVFLRHSPLVRQAPLPPGAIAVTSGHPTRLVDVSDPERTWATMTGKCRNHTRKATKVGATAEIRPATPDDLREDAPFRTLYAATMERRRAAGSYLFSSDYFGRLLDALGTDLLIGLVRNASGSVIASTLLMLHRPYLHYHLSGVNVEGTSCGAMNLLLWTACRIAPEHGASLLHLGGGRAPYDDLYRFKTAFGGRDLEFRASGLIVEPGRYERLLAGRQAVAGGFFPAYRARYD